MKIVIIRHADPDYEHNTLTEHGFLEAEALGKKYSGSDFDYIYCSPLNRAKITCEAITKEKKEYETCDWLQEFWYPVTIDGEKRTAWDFKPSMFENIDDIYDYNKYLDTDLMKSGDIKNGINYVYSEFEKILEKHGYKKEQKLFKVMNSNRDTLLFVCHLGMMSVLMSYLMNIPYCVIANHMCCVPSGVTTFVTEEREEGIAHFRMLKFGDTSHLLLNKINESFHGRFCETFDSDERH